MKEVAKYEAGVWYYLDPDNNKDTPACGLYCERCKRKLKENLFQTYHSIIKHPDSDTPWFRMAVGLDEVLKIETKLIGADCLNKVISEYGIMAHLKITLK